MILPVRRMLQVILLSLGACAFLLLVGCGLEGDTRQAKQDNKTAKKARTDSEKKSDVPVKQLAFDKGGEVKPLADWIGQLQNKDQDSEARRSAASALAGFGNSAVPALGEILLKDKDTEVRQNAAVALGRIGKPAVPVLVTALKSTDRETRLLAVGSFRILAARGDRRDARQAIPVLAELLKEDDKDFRWEVATILMGLGDEAGEALPALLLASKIPDTGGDCARRSLEGIRKAPRSTAPALIALLKDEEPYIRLKVAEVLCDMEEGDKECLACLLKLIKRRDSQIRQGAARLLSRYGSAAKDAVPALIEVVRTDELMPNDINPQAPIHAINPQARIHAINALGAIGPDAKEASPLLKAMQDDPLLGGCAKTALKKIEQ